MSSAAADEGLPAGWQAGKASDGRVFYINHQLQKTQWQHPLTGKMTAGPNGWRLIPSRVMFILLSLRRIQPAREQCALR